MTKYEYRKLYLGMMNIGMSALKDISLDRKHINMIKNYLKKRDGKDIFEKDVENKERGMYQ